MDASAYTALATAVEPITIALIAAVATGGPGLIFTIYRWRKTAPVERDDLITKAAQQAVEAMEVAINAAARERKDLLSRVDLLEDRGRQLERRVRQLEEAWPDGHGLPDALVV